MQKCDLTTITTVYRMINGLFQNIIKQHTGCYVKFDGKLVSRIKQLAQMYCIDLEEGNDTFMIVNEEIIHLA